MVNTAHGTVQVQPSAWLNSRVNTEMRVCSEGWDTGFSIKNNNHVRLTEDYYTVDVEHILCGFPVEKTKYCIHFGETYRRNRINVADNYVTGLNHNSYSRENVSDKSSLFWCFCAEGYLICISEYTKCVHKLYLNIRYVNILFIYFQNGLSQYFVTKTFSQ